MADSDRQRRFVWSEDDIEILSEKKHDKGIVKEIIEETIEKEHIDENHPH